MTFYSPDIGVATRIPLGDTQRAVLRAMVRKNGEWSAGGDWIWKSPANTLKIMNSLAKRGLVTCEATEPYPRYAVIAAGRAVAAGVGIEEAPRDPT